MSHNLDAWKKKHKYASNEAAIDALIHQWDLSHCAICNADIIADLHEYESWAEGTLCYRCDPGAWSECE